MVVQEGVLRVFKIRVPEARIVRRIAALVAEEALLVIDSSLRRDAQRESARERERERARGREGERESERASARAAREGGRAGERASERTRARERSRARASARKSMTGHLFSLKGVTLSSAEAEFVTASQAGQESVNFRALLRSFNFRQVGAHRDMGR